MDEKTIIAPAGEDNKTETATTETATTEATVEKEVTVGEALNVEPKKEPRLVPEAALIEYKKENKELAKEIKELRKAIESGASKKEVSEDIKSIAEEYGVDEEFLGKLASTIKSQAEAEAEAKVSSKLKPLEEKEKAERMNQAFEEHFSKVIESMPEYKDIVNKEIIKVLSLDPKNANKSFAKILEEAYGHLVVGKRTIESTKPRGGAGDTEIDFNKAKSDSEYFNEILSNPELKKKYNDNLAERLRL